MQRLLLARLLAALLLTLGACQSLPAAREDRLPTAVVLSDGSVERQAMNARVWDAATDFVERNFYQRDFGGRDWLADVAAARAEAIVQPDETGFYRALNAVLSQLDDRHTSATPPSLNLRSQEQRLQATPRFGLAFETASEAEGGGVYVIRVVAGSAAADAGVQPGWRLVSVDEAPYRAASVYAASSHRWAFVDAAGVDRAVEMTARPTARELATITRRPDDVLVIRFDEFDADTRRFVLARLTTELVRPPRAVIMDLRSNRGGLDSEVGRLLSPFFSEPRQFAVVVLPRFPDRRLRTRPGRVRYDGPLAVLTSIASASGAEVFAAAIQETRRGPVVGGLTRGAVVGSHQYDLPDGGRLSVGVVAFRTGSGMLLEHVGVTPDLPVLTPVQDLKVGRDTVLEVAVVALTAPVAPTP